MAEFDEFEDFIGKIIELNDEDGETFQFELIDVIDFEGRKYGLLLPADDEDDTLIDNEEEKEVVLMRISKIMGETVYELIDSDEEFKKVEDYINSFYEDEDEDDE